MEPIIAIARHEFPEASLARTICVLCDRNALGCACAPLVLEKGEPPDVGTPDRTLHELLYYFLAKDGCFEALCDNPPERDMPWWYGNLVAHLPHDAKGDGMTGVTAYLQPWRIPVRNCWTAAREEE